MGMEMDFEKFPLFKTTHARVGRLKIGEYNEQKNSIFQPQGWCK